MSLGLTLTGANTLMGVGAGRFDGHAHVFRADLPMSAERRYAPSYDATVEAYAALLATEGLDGALLVQPSFLGTDNSFLLATLAEAAAAPSITFRGVAVLASATSREEMRRMDAAGVVGLRLNVLGSAWGGALDFDAWDAALRSADSLGWHVELHCEGPRLPSLLPGLLARCERVVVDHFGRPSPGAADDVSGFGALLAAPRGRVFVKTSAPYRVFPDHSIAAAALGCASLFRRLLDRFGPERLLWGSDWPWTQHEGRWRFSEAAAWERLWLEAIDAAPSRPTAARREAG